MKTLYRIPVGVALIATVLHCASTPGAVAVELAPGKREIKVDGRNVYIPVKYSQPLTEVDPRITRVLFSIHSSDFDAVQYFENAKSAASKVPGALDATLIVAPQFLEATVVPAPIPDGLLFWKVSPYRGSAKASEGSEGHELSISAYEVMDHWLEEIVRSGNFRNLTDIVIVGHSAGGQFVQRYAMVGKFDPPESVRCRYVVSAPSSYAYPSGERFDPGSKTFRIPDKDAQASCPDYNHWGYGLDEPYTYFADLDGSVIARRYAERIVLYLCGDQDNDPTDEALGNSCGARWQGNHRLERMEIFTAFLAFKYGREITRRHSSAIVPGVPHHGLGTMTSPEGLKFLFGPMR